MRDEQAGNNTSDRSKEPGWYRTRFELGMDDGGVAHDQYEAGEPEIKVAVSLDRRLGMMD